jgi:hypothetical protein
VCYDGSSSGDGYTTSSQTVPIIRGSDTRSKPGSKSRKIRLPSLPEHLELRLAVEHGAARLPVDVVDGVVAELERLLFGDRVDDLERSLLVAFRHSDLLGSCAVLRRVEDASCRGRNGQPLTSHHINRCEFA